MLTLEFTEEAPPKRGRGRPKKHLNAAARQKAYAKAETQAADYATILISHIAAEPDRALFLIKMYHDKHEQIRRAMSRLTPEMLVQFQTALNSVK